MDLDSAIESLHEIRHQLSRSATFTGYRPLFLTAVAALAAVLAIFQAIVPIAPTMAEAYAEWMGLASLIVVLTILFVFVPSLRSKLSVVRSVARGVAGQFTPFVVAGAVGTIIAYRLAPQLIPYLPATWCAAFGLSIFAMQPYLPRLVSMSGGWYLIMATVLGVWPPHSVAALAAGMGTTFAVGHLVTAGIMKVALPRKTQ